MDSFGGYSLGAGGFLVLELNDEADDGDYIFETAGGAEVVVPSKRNWLLVRGLGEGSRDATVSSGQDAANRTLDVYLASRGRALTVEASDSPVVAGWRSGATRHVALLARERLVGRLTVGGPPPRGRESSIGSAVSPGWRESLRYYRVSESSSDLYDSFRNLYLALESHLSEMTHRGSDGEGAWLKRALTDADKRVDLNAFAPPSGPAGTTAIYGELWTQLRNTIFHAKSGSTKHVPHDPSSRAAIQEARARYANLFRTLVAADLNLPYSHGGSSQWLLDNQAAQAIHALDVCLFGPAYEAKSEVEIPIALTDPRLHRMTSSLAPEFDAPGIRAIRAKGRASDISMSIGSVAGMLTANATTAMSYELLPALLTLEDADQVEVIFTAEARSYWQPRSNFST